MPRCDIVFPSEIHIPLHPFICKYVVFSVGSYSLSFSFLTQAQFFFFFCPVPFFPIPSLFHLISFDFISSRFTIHNLYHQSHFYSHFHSHSNPLPNYFCMSSFREPLLRVLFSCNNLSYLLLPSLIYSQDILYFPDPANHLHCEGVSKSPSSRRSARGI